MSREYFIIFWQKRYGVSFEYVPWKNVQFIFVISIVWVHFSHKIDKFWLWRSLKYFNIFDKKGMMSDFNMLHRKISDVFFSLPLFGFTLINKQKFWFWKLLKGFISYFFLIKKWCQSWPCPVKQCLILFKLCCL